MGKWTGSRTAAAALALGLFSAACGGSGASSASGDVSGSDMTVGLILKTLSNPYFGEMKQAATKKAEALGVELIVKAGKYDGDVATQISAIETFKTRQVDAIVIVPNVSSGVSSALKKAKQAGIEIIAADTAVKPESLTASFVATDNFKAGKLNGRWAKAALQGEKPVVALLEGTPGSTVNTARLQGFLDGFGMKKSEVAVDLITNADRSKAQTAMENALAKNPDINLVWTINEPVALGAAAAIAAKGLADETLLVSMDGSCRGIKAVQTGKIDTDVMQFPAKMARTSVAIAVKAARDKDVPDRIDTGEVLVTTKSHEGVPSEGISYGLQHCWG